MLSKIRMFVNKKIGKIQNFNYHFYLQPFQLKDLQCCMPGLVPEKRCNIIEGSGKVTPNDAIQNDIH